jgi:retinol dehydrogenase-14
MAGKTVLVTGASAGIGQATAFGLAALGAHVAIIGRDRRRLLATARRIRDTGVGTVDVFVADLSSQSDVRALGTELLARLSRLDVLVNNVGGYWNTRHLTQDGLEHTFALNHLASFLATTVTANAAHPGMVDTSLGAADPGRTQRALVPILRPLMKTPAQGAATSVHLATAPELAETTGLYFARCRPRKSSPRSYDTAVAARLWQVSAELTAGPTAPAGGTGEGWAPEPGLGSRLPALTVRCAALPNTRPLSGSHRRSADVSRCGSIPDGQ